MAKFSGIEMIENRDRSLTAPVGFYSGNPALKARYEQNTQLSQKRLFSSNLEKAKFSCLDWSALTGSRAGRTPYPDRL